MKRILTAAVVGGLTMFVVPQAAFAGSGVTARVAPYDHSADHAGEEQAPRPNEANQPEQAPPEHRAERDARDPHDGRDTDDGGFLLF